jgi:hypothetical protein
MHTSFLPMIVSLVSFFAFCQSYEFLWQLQVLCDMRTHRTLDSTLSLLDRPMSPDVRYISRHLQHSIASHHLQPCEVVFY